MAAADTLLDDVRAQIAPDDRVLKAARDRLAAVRAAAETFKGVRRSFRSGSVAHFTANDPVKDADGGVVLDRTVYRDLGPDGADVGPGEIVEAMRQHLRTALVEDFPGIGFRLTKRAIKVLFRDPVLEEQDPTADLIVALTRREKPGLWIPNLKSGTWDASDPEAHTSLLEVAYEATGHALQRAVRLVKAWNGRFSEPALSSFNIEALGLEAITEKMKMAEAVRKLLDHGATSLAKANTVDPAGVSGRIRLLADRGIVVKRLRTAAGHLATAIAAGSDEAAARTALAEVFPDYVTLPTGSLSKAALAAALAAGGSTVRVGPSGRVSLDPAQGRTVTSTRSFGAGPRE
jgi:hypothetical protein